MYIDAKLSQAFAFVDSFQIWDEPEPQSFTVHQSSTY